MGVYEGFHLAPGCLGGFKVTGELGPCISSDAAIR